RLGEPYIVVVVVVLVVVVMTTPVVEVVVVVGDAVVVVGGRVVVVVLGAVLVVVLVLVVVVPAPNTACQASANAWPLWPGRATIDDVASSSTRLLVPAGAGRPTTALTAASSDPSPFGPHPVAPGTANMLSPCTAPLITIVANGPFGSGTPFASKFSALNDAFVRSVFAGIRRIGSTSEPMKQLGPRSMFWPTRWILHGMVMIGPPSSIPAMKLKFEGRRADWTEAVTVTPPAVTVAGSATSAPVGDPTTVVLPLISSRMTPTCRLLFPVAVVVVPIVMLPCVEFEATQSASVV